MTAHPQRTPEGVAVFGNRWGITKDQLRTLARDCRSDVAWSDDDTIRDFVEKFVKPRTRGLGMGLSLMLNRDSPKRVNLMISHAWDENASCFFNDLEAHVHEDEVVFLCFLALYQCADGAGPSIGDQLGPDIYAGPFCEVIESLRPTSTLGRWLGRASGRMLVLSNQQCPLYTRLWCVWEAYIASTRGVPTDYTRCGRLFADASASSADARCGDPRLPMNEDERKIRQAIENLPVETWRSLTGSSAAIAALLAAVVVPLGIFSTWTVGLGIAGAVVKLVAMIIDFFSKVFSLAPWIIAVSQVASWILKLVGSGLFLGAGLWAAVSVAFGFVCWCFVSRRRLRASCRLSGKLADQRNGYGRLDSIVRRAAKEA